MEMEPQLSGAGFGLQQRATVQRPTVNFAATGAGRSQSHSIQIRTHEITGENMRNHSLEPERF